MCRELYSQRCRRASLVARLALEERERCAPEVLRGRDPARPDIERPGKYLTL